METGGVCLTLLWLLGESNRCFYSLLSHETHQSLVTLHCWPSWVWPLNLSDFTTAPQHLEPAVGTGVGVVLEGGGMCCLDSITFFAPLPQGFRHRKRRQCLPPLPVPLASIISGWFSCFLPFSPIPHPLHSVTLKGALSLMTFQSHLPPRKIQNNTAPMLGLCPCSSFL